MTFMNRLANTSNRFQGPAKRVLCVCSAGLLRSPTTANVLHKEYGFNTRAAGITDEYALIPVDEVLLAWAEEIVWVEQKVYDTAKYKFPEALQHKRNIVLNVPDMYGWGQPELEAIIKKQYADVAIMEQAV